MTHLEEIEKKLADNQINLDAVRTELAEAESAADDALLEGGPSALLEAQADLQKLKDRVAAFERYAGVLADQRQAAKAEDAKPQMTELVGEAHQQVDAEDAAYRKAITAADAAVKAVSALNDRCSETSATLARIRGLASGAGIESNACGEVRRPGAHVMQMEIERELATRLMEAGQLVQLVRSNCRAQGI